MPSGKPRYWRINSAMRMRSFGVMATWLGSLPTSASTEIDRGVSADVLGHQVARLGHYVRRHQEVIGYECSSNAAQRP
jgi:hypothetical protein